MQLNFFGMTYNGNKRHLEAAEVYRNGCSTYCRRIGAFRRSPQRTGPLFNGDERPEMLERQWRNWVMEESRRRLGFCCFVSFFLVLGFLSPNRFQIAYLWIVERRTSRSLFRF